MTLNLTAPPPESQLKPRIVVVGVGGAGSNAVNNMIASNLEGVEFVVANTDAQSLAMNSSERRIQLGANITSGLGAGARPDIGRAAAEEALDEIIDHLQGSHMAFIAAGMGGGTGTGAAPVIARAAREQGILTVGVVTKPFQFEGRHRATLADEGIEELQHFVDTLIVIPNQNLFRICNENTTFADAFCMADNVLHSGVRGVTDLMIMPGLINLDFADIRTVMSEMGKAMMGTGEAGGDRRAIESAEAAIANPLLDDVSMRGARGVLINITGGPDMTLFEVDEAANRIREEVDADANIIFGTSLDQNMEGTMRVSIVATGIDADASSLPRPSQISLIHDADQLKAQKTGTEDIVQNTIAEVVSEKRNPEVFTEAPAVAETPTPAIKEEAEPSITMKWPEETDGSAPSTIAAFIPPKPAAVERQVDAAAQPRKADAFAEADITNAGVQAERHRGRSLFQKVTGAVNRAMAEEQTDDKPEATKRREPIALKSPTVASSPATPIEAELAPEAKATSELVAVTKPIVAEGLELIAAKRVAPAQQSLEDIKPAKPRQSASKEEDMLEIPAFLRRQAN
ncbi:MAG: cell division protein FtsZ [Alphaproteobacteria bacterium]|nr:cell division protein FtsZ [Alphaproteobacteria bacterium]